VELPKYPNVCVARSFFAEEIFMFPWLQRSPAKRSRSQYRPHLEALEERDLLSLASLLPAPFLPAAAGLVGSMSVPKPIIVTPTTTIQVHAGGSIQAAIDAAPGSGAVIVVDPGTYDSFVVAKPNIQIIGLSQGGVVIQQAGQDNGIMVTSAGSGFVLRNVTVRGFRENGILLQGVAGFLLSHVTAQSDGEYGLFPVLSAHGRIEYCTASGHHDTGIYVGESSDIAIVGNRTFDNLNGIEIENSVNVRALGNNSYHNTAGMLIDLLPGLDVKVCHDILVSGNFIHDNNLANSATGGIEALVPAGTGILIIGADKVTVQFNVVTGNQFIGIGLVSSTILTALGGISTADIEPNPDGDRIVGNIVLGNGTGPAPIPAILPTGADLIWDGSGSDNLWIGNVFTTSFWPGSPLPLPGE
jgi:parallel beta-helix repeat protein